MMARYVLDNVIKRLNKAEASDIKESETSKLIIIDTETKTVVKKKRSFLESQLARLSIGSPQEYFLVGNEEGHLNSSESDIKFFINDRGFSFRKPSSYSISVTLTYKVSCPPDNEEQVALALFDENSSTPGVVFERKLLGWLKASSERRTLTVASLFKNYDEILSELGEDVENEAEKIGLRLEAILSLELDDPNCLKPFAVESNDFPIVFKDFEEKVNFNFEANLDIAEDGKINAILSYRKLAELKEVLREAVRKYIRQNVYLYDAVYEFNQLVRPKLLKHLDTEILREHGRKVDSFSLNFSHSLKMPEPSSIKHNIKIKVSGYLKDVTINNSLDVEPIFISRDNAASEIGEGARLNKARTSLILFQRGKVLDLVSWFQSELEKIVTKHLFDWSYINVLLKYDSESNKEELKKKLNEKANAIGYSVRVISTVPALRPIVYRTEGFRFNSGEEGEVFSSKQNSVKIKLYIDVRGKIEDLSTIEHLLENPKTNIEKIIGEEIVDTTKRILRTVEAADFYAQEGRISYLDDFSSDSESIRDQISNAITHSLEKRFGASFVEVSLQSLDTELLDLVNRLVGKTHNDFEIFINSVRDAGEQVQCTGSFQVTGVAKDKWDTFASCKPEVEDVKDFLQNQLRYWFSTLSSESVNFTTTQGLLKLLGDANVLASKAIMDNFGVLIAIHRFEPSDTEFKAAQRELQKINNLKLIDEAKEQISRDKQLRALEGEISINDMKHLNEELMSVRALLKALSTQVGNKSRKELLVLKETELKNKLSKLLQENREKSSNIKLERMNQSISPPSEESDFDALVKQNRQLLEGNQANGQDSDTETTPSENDNVIDV